MTPDDIRTLADRYNAPGEWGGTPELALVLHACADVVEAAQWAMDDPKTGLVPLEAALDKLEAVKP